MYCFVCGCFVVQLHQDHRVEGIDGRHQERLRIPVVMSLREWFQVIVAPRVFLVTVPGVEKLRFHLSGEFPVGLLGLDRQEARVAAAGK